MSNNLLFGYYPISKNNLWDLGNDPYFHSKPFSWGVCRPNNRSKIKLDSRIFFYTFKTSLAGDYYLTGMMKVNKILNQIEASQDRNLYCGFEEILCPAKLIINPEGDPIIDKRNNYTIMNRKCRSNIVIDSKLNYKDYCDGGNHFHIFEKYIDKPIYFVSTENESLATRRKIRLLDYLPNSSKFWFGRFQGYELSNLIADQLQNILIENSN